MDDLLSSARETPVGLLRRLAQPRRPVEQCEFCSAPMGPKHRHLLEAATRKIVCACEPCAVLFQHTAGARWKLIPRDARPLRGFRLSDEQWNSLSLPIGLAFFCRNTLQDKVTAMYPSPAGATESLLPLANWEALVAENPGLREIQPDVEALLVNRVGTAREHFMAPIDQCYELVGLIRRHWRGLNGGEAVWKEIDGFFRRLSDEAPPEFSVPQAVTPHGTSAREPLGASAASRVGYGPAARRRDTGAPGGDGRQDAPAPSLVEEVGHA